MESKKHGCMFGSWALLAISNIFWTLLLQIKSDYKGNTTIRIVSNVAF